MLFQVKPFYIWLGHVSLGYVKLVHVRPG